MKKLVIIFAALVMVAALAACGGSAPTSNEDPGNQGNQNNQAQGEQAQRDQNQGDQDEQKEQRTAPDVQVAPDRGDEEKEQSADAPKNKSLTLTVPKMEMIQYAGIPHGPGDDDQLFKENAAVHLEGTGHPWEEEANVYIAGHRLGFPGEPSYLAFWDIDKLQNGDEIFVEDANGREYTYKVFNVMVVEPTDLWVLEPEEGKNILSLQSCTLPDYSDRYIVQAELQKNA